MRRRLGESVARPPGGQLAAPTRGPESPRRGGRGGCATLDAVPAGSHARDPHAQEDYSVRLRWGRRGARDAARVGDVLVVVDVLSFATAAVLAVDRGARIFPTPRGPEAGERARALGAELAVGRSKVPAKGRLSLSPATMLTLAPGERVVLPSPNGATCTDAGRAGAAAVFVSGLVNASATARVAEARARQLGRALTVLACGERWVDPEPPDERMRVALEDLLGAGAVLAACQGRASPEAQMAADAFRGARDQLRARLFECASGIELVDRGFSDDVERAATLDSVDRAVVLAADGGLEATS